jgi:hypothetical protein
MTHGRVPVDEAIIEVVEHVGRTARTRLRQALRDVETRRGLPDEMRRMLRYLDQRVAP